MADHGPSITAARLWEKTSAKGTTYLTWRMGNLRISILPDCDRKDDSDPTHVLIFGEAQRRESDARPSVPAAAPDMGGRFGD